jgi:hypothetical protein
MSKYYEVCPFCKVELDTITDLEKNTTSYYCVEHGKVPPIKSAVVNKSYFIEKLVRELSSQ